MRYARFRASAFIDRV